VTAAAVTVNTGPSDCIGRLSGSEGESISRLGSPLSLVDKGMRAKGPQWHVQCQWHRGSTVRPLHSVTLAAACASGKIGLWARAADLAGRCGKALSITSMHSMTHEQKPTETEQDLAAQRYNKRT
jgi:hypothetical protein